MPNFQEIIKEYADLTHFAGGDGIDENEKKIAEETKRVSLTKALNIRKKECSFRFKIAVALLLAALGILLYLSLFQPQRLKAFKEIMSFFGGGSIIAVLLYLISVRDELTKIEQTLVIVAAVDSATLSTMLITLSARS